MMDRRKLILGGGAAAVATTLSAVTGTGAPAQAAPRRTRLRLTSTADHARRVLDEVDVDRGLVDPAGLQRQYEECYAALVASLPREPRPDDLETWIRRRMVELCGTDSYVEAIKIPGTRSLLVFALLAYSQNQDRPLPRLDPGMPVPPVFEKLEPDFLPVLRDLITEKSNDSREFASALEATSAELDRIIAEKLRELSGDKVGKDHNGGRGQAQAAPGSPGAGDALGFLLAVGVFMAFYYWVKRELKL